MGDGSCFLKVLTPIMVSKMCVVYFRQFNPFLINWLLGLALDQYAQL